jgi:hypothetical protein
VGPLELTVSGSVSSCRNPSATDRNLYNHANRSSEGVASTMEPPPRPFAASVTGTTPRWVRIVPSIQVGELVIWRSIAALVGLSIVGMLFGLGRPCDVGIDLGHPAMVIAEGQAPWWTSTRHLR